MTILVCGEALIDFLPGSPGPLSTVETFSRRPGGAPANVAVGLARLDAPTRLWTRVGADPFGDFLVETLLDEGLPTDDIERDAGAKTALAFVSLGADADREFSFHRTASADTRFDPARVDEVLDSAVSWVHVGGVTLADEPARTATLDLMRAASEAGATVSFDPNARPELWTDFDYADSLEAALSRTDVAKVSAADLSAGGFDVDVPPGTLAGSVAVAGPHTVLLTRGSEGALAYAAPGAPWNPTDEPMVVEHAGFPVEAVDTTGAGDAFTAGVIASLSADEPLAEGLAAGNAVAALTTTEPGAMTALPTRAALSAFREEHASAE